MRMVRLLGFGGCEGGVGAEVVQVEGGRVGRDEEGLGRLGGKDRGRINCIPVTALPTDS